MSITKKEIQNKMIGILLNIIEGDVTSFYMEGEEDNGLIRKPLGLLTPEQRMCVEDIQKGEYRIHSKLKAMEALSKLTGLNTVNHILSVDEDDKPSINFNISFVNKDSKE